MCDIKDGFKLCTCEEKLHIQEIGWVLKRTNDTLPLAYRKGRAVIPRYNANEKELQTLILNNLNSRNSFDFDYTPHDNDLITIKARANDKSECQWYAYRFQRNKWNIDTSDSLAAWKTQLEKFKEGIVE